MVGSAMNVGRAFYSWTPVYAICAGNHFCLSCRWTYRTLTRTSSMSSAPLTSTTLMTRVEIAMAKTANKLLRKHLLKSPERRQAAKRHSKMTAAAQVVQLLPTLLVAPHKTALLANLVHQAVSVESLLRHLARMTHTCQCRTFTRSRWAGTVKG